MAANWMPQPTEEHKKLHRLAGAWAGDETLSPSPWGAGGPAKGRMMMHIACDGFFVTQDYVEEKDGQTVFRGHGVFGYDAQQKSAIWYWVDSMGMPPTEPARGRWEGETLTFESHTGPARSRYTFRFEGTERMHFRIENSPDGGPLQTFMEGTYRRERG